MSQSYTEPELISFLDFTVKKGLLNEATARSRKVAALRILQTLDESEKADLRTIDRDLVFQRFVNKSGKSFAPNSLQSYRSRFIAALDDFIRYTDNPVTFRPGAGVRELKTNDEVGGAKQPTNRRSKTIVLNARQAPALPAPPLQAPSKGPEMLRLSYPIRADVLAEVAIPRGMKLEEARRFCAFILTLATDFVPAESRNL